MSRLLISDPPLMVIPRLAVLIGLNEAIVLQQVHFRSHARGVEDGWVQRSYSTWREKDFPWWSEITIKRAFGSLADRQLIERERSAQTGGEVQVRVNYDAVEALESDQDDPTGSYQSDTTGRITVNRPVGADRSDPCREEEGKAREGLTPLAGAGELDRLPASDFSGLCQLLADGLRRLDPKAPVAPDSPKWLADMRALVERDERTVEEVRLGIEAGLADKHFAARITSPAALRRTFPSLSIRLQPWIDRAAERSAEACPGAAGAAALERWAPAPEQLRSRIGEAKWSIHLADLHPHRLVDGTLVLGAAPERVRWIRERFAVVLADAAGGAVEIVACRDASERGAA